ncbi:MAG: hypothetical protein VB060_10055 [Oscillibacter sp.]|nr:hypothetical protein [Oscillibacter sp.]MEA4994153.1 hypothetical protein [Oscillibacter sp.]
MYGIRSCIPSSLADTAYALFLANYHWEKPIRSIGIRGSGQIETGPYEQTSLFQDARHRDRWERIDRSMDALRQRYGYLSVQRAVLKTLDALT